MVSRLLKMVCAFNQVKNNKTLNKDKTLNKEREKIVSINYE